MLNNNFYNNTYVTKNAIEKVLNNSKKGKPLKKGVIGY